MGERERKSVCMCVGMLKRDGGWLWAAGKARETGRSDTIIDELLHRGKCVGD